MLKKFLNALIIVVSFSLPVFKADAKDVVLIINLMSQDKMIWNRKQGKMSTDFVTKHSKLEVIVVEPTSNEHLHSELSRHFDKTSKKIAYLFFYAHGQYFSRYNTFYLSSTSSTSSNSLSIDINSVSAANVFAPIKGHFKENAVVFFNSCNIFDTTADKVDLLVKRLSDLFMVNKFYVFGNKTVGALPAGFFEASPAGILTAHMSFPPIILLHILWADSFIKGRHYKEFRTFKMSRRTFFKKMLVVAPLSIVGWEASAKIFHRILNVGRLVHYDHGKSRTVSIGESRVFTTLLERMASGDQCAILENLLE